VDMSNIVKSAIKIVEDNKLSDKIQIIQGKVEEITLPVDKVTREHCMYVQCFVEKNSNILTYENALNNL
jgi:hypothetical protein